MDGSAVCVYMEGSRPILCELQSLVTYSHLPSPRRTSGTVQYTPSRHLLYTINSQNNIILRFCTHGCLDNISLR